VGAASASALPAIVPASRQEALPLSFAQQRLWFLVQLDERAGAAYAIPGGVRLKGLLDVAALRAALNRMVARHETLRTCFASVDGALVQVIAPPEVGVALTEVDLSQHSDSEAELERLADEEASAPFDLVHGPLVRARLIRLADEDHALLVTMHHIVSDGWSMGVLVNEFSALYAAYSQGQPDSLPPLAIQYADYAVWQRRWITGEVLQRQLDFWRDHLSGAPALLELPTDRPRPPVQDYAGASFGFELDAELTANLKALSQRHGTTLFMTLLASWAVLLARLSGQHDVVIGTPVANRHRAEIEPLIGFFVNMQALRVDVSGSPSVAELLAQVRATALAAQEHQDIPFEQVVEVLSPIRSMAHSPIFQVMFAWQNVPEGSLDLPGLQLEPVGASATTVKFDLELTLQAAGERITGSLGYACALFDRSSIERHVGHWQALLRALVADDGACVDRLPLLTPTEQQHILHLFNDTATAFPREQCIHQLFEQQAACTPAATALVFEGTSLAYGDLNAQANRLAHHLIALGVRPDSRVAIALPRGIDMVVALLATLKAGGAYVPLDPDYPTERLAYMLTDSSPCVLVTDSATRHALGDLPDSLAVLPLDADRSRQWLPATNPDPAALGLTSSHLAYVIYTSGSTGQPKGVMVEHQQVVNFLGSMARKPGVDARDTVLATTSLSFDIAGLELYLPLSLGARLVLVPREVTQDGTALAQLIDASSATVMQATPATWRMLLEAGWQPRRELKLLCGGEALSRQLADTLLAPGGELWNLYGPTETTIWSTAEQMVAGQVGVTIGRPIANTHIYILDAAGAPVPVGVLGQLYIGGGGVARGYLRRPDLTAERFVPDPFGEPGSRMYKTGDVARWRPDGSIEFLGRNDHQVKIRGFRIELGEIETALAHHPGVSAVAVMAREHAPGDSRLVAYVVPRADDDAAASDDAQSIGFSLFYFGADAPDPANRYGLYMASAQYADRHGFEAVWTPERHFHAVGGLYANPSVLSAALATVTQRIHLRSGSVVMPLHHPVRVAEEWAMVDNLSHGRVGLAIASGWHPRDFVFNPDAHASRKQVMFDGIEVVRALWRGESVALRNGEGVMSDIRIHPQPLQKELPLWVTAAGNPDTFIQAGKLGANLLTHLLGQDMDDLEEKIAQYRQARLEAGLDPEAGRVTLMIHAFVGDDAEQVRQQAKGPFIRYLKEHFGLASLMKQFKHTAAAQAEQDLEVLAELAFERYAQTASLIGTPQSCLALVQEAKRIGVDELGCLIDWMDAPSVMSGLEPLNRLRQLAQRTQPGARELRRFLADRLPEYMIPAAYVAMDTLPLTPNGKLDRKALPAPGSKAFLERPYEAPIGEVENLMAALWRELLGVERVGRHDNFFELGGHSLLAIRFVELMRKAAMRIDVRDLFVHPTLHGMAQAVQFSETGVKVPPNRIPEGCVAITPDMLTLIDLTSEQIAQVVSTVPGGATNIQDIYPLSPLQESLLFLHLMREEGGDFLMKSVLGFDTRAEVDAFVEALQAVVDRHDILRTAVLWDGMPEPVQVVWRRARVIVEEAVLSADGGDAATQLDERCGLRDEWMDVRQAPLLRVIAARDGADGGWKLAIVNHLLIGDGESIKVLTQEIQAVLQGQADTLPPPTPYRNYVAQSRLGVAREEHEAFFRKMLSHVDEPTAPLGLLNVRDERANMQRTCDRLPDALALRLSEQARSHAVSVAALFHLAWAWVVSALSGRDAVVFGTVMFGRMEGAASGDLTPGAFTNIVPMAIKISDDSVARSVRLTQEVLSQLMRHEHAPQALALRCSAVRPPELLFSALLNFRHGDAMAATATESSGPQLLERDERAYYPFTLEVDHVGNEFRLTARMSAKVDTKRVLNYVHTALLRVVEALEYAPETPLSSLDILPPDERRQLLEGWNGEALPLPAARGVQELFEAQARAHAQRVAVECEGRQLSYGELNRHANRLAHYLRMQGVGPDTPVAICIDRSIEMVVGLLAILKAGGAYVPLDPSYPPQRLSYIAKDSGCALMLVTASTQDLARSLLNEAPIVDVGAEAHRWAAAPDEDVDSGAMSHHLAYVIYTSGSTGQPKGVMIEHGALVSYTIAAAALFGIHVGDRVLQQNSLAFDLSLEEMLPALIAGASVHLSRTPMLAGASPGKANVLHLTAAHWHTLIGDWHRNKDVARDQLRDVHTINVTGDALSPQSLAQWQALHLSGTRLVNTYGPTEATVSCTAALLGEGPDGGHSQQGQPRVTIGRPLPNVRIYLLDAKGRPVPKGVPGEMHIAGVQVARGYLNRPELTAERFVPDPYSPEPGARMYKTGDLARWRDDGTIDFLGRSDHQVKVRGFRIELGEIEAALQRIAGVREAVVLAREEQAGVDQPSPKRLVAYVVTDEGIASQTLHEQLAALLPEYMLPVAYVHLDALPLTPGGKLDRKALPAPESFSLGNVGRYEAPQGELEELLSQAWAQVLGLERVGRHDSFFDLGGHSLLALQAMSRVGRQVGREVPLHLLFSNPTVAALARRIGELDRAEEFRNRVAVRTSGSGVPLFIIHAGDGEVGYAFDLAPHLPEQHPLYALAAIGFAEGETPLWGVEAMAAWYLRAIRNVQPHGPYHLIGWSAGGMIAYEIAAQLLATGEQVAFVGVIDTLSDYSSTLDGPGQEPTEAQSLERYVRAEFGHELADQLTKYVDRGDVDEMFELCRRHGAIDPGIEHATLRRHLAVRHAIALSLARYRPQPIAASLSVFTADDEGHADARLGWDDVAQHGLEVVALPGTHWSIVDPAHIGALGLAISHALAAAGVGRVKHGGEEVAASVV
jgi:natural product biosynthesis luciferase-like monooxygenase protein/amino acid adenylation domain-containing protein